MAVKKKKQKLVVGRWDRIDFPEINLFDIEAKIDTGAYTSALHVSHLQEIEMNGKLHLQFRLIHHKHKQTSGDPFILPLHARKRIKSSNGISRMRYLIRTKVLILGKTYLTEFSLADRSQMDFPVLLGRKLLSGRFVVDVSRKNISYQQKKNKKGTQE